MARKIIRASDLHGAMYLDNSHYDDEWALRLLKIWIATRKAFLAEGWTLETYRQVLMEAVVKECDVEDSYRYACNEAGIRVDFSSKLYADYHALAVKDAMDVIPSGLHGELSWVPGWDGQSLDDLMDQFGLRSERSRSSYIEDVIPGQWLTTFLKMVNCSSVDLIGEAIAQNADTGRAFAEKCAAANFKVEKDQNRHQILTAAQVITHIENAYWLAAPTFHCEIDIRALFLMDPRQDMRLTTDKGGLVHVGFHEGFNGAGHMDTYPGEVVVPHDATGFLQSDRWNYGINKVYGLHRPVFHATPVAVVHQ